MASITNPHLGLPTEGGWAMGFAWGYIGPAFSKDPPSVIAPEQIDAFNEGTLAGQQAAIEGLDVDPPCISLTHEPSGAVEGFTLGLHIFEASKLFVDASTAPKAAKIWRTAAPAPSLQHFYWPFRDRPARSGSGIPAAWFECS